MNPTVNQPKNTIKNFFKKFLARGSDAPQEYKPSEYVFIEPLEPLRVLSALGPDVGFAGDPNDQISEATHVGDMTGGTPIQTGISTIASPTDVNMFSFDVAAGQRIGIDVDLASGSTLDSVLRVFDASGNELVMNDDAAAPGESFTQESYLEYTFAAAGRYFVGLSGYYNANYNALTGDGDSSGDTGSATLRLTNLPPLAGDNDDQISEARPVTINPTGTTLVSGSVSSGQDVDMISFTVVAGQRFEFDIDQPSGSTLDSYIRLFDRNGMELTQNDDAAAPGESQSLESYLDYTFATGGTYYLGISGYGNSNYDAISGNGDGQGRTGDYLLGITALGSPDTDDQISEAVALGAAGAVPLTASGVISSIGDVDIYSFTVVQGKRLTFDIDRPPGSSVDSYIRLFDSSGVQLAANDNGRPLDESASVESYLNYTFQRAGTYYLGVSGFRNSAYNAVTGDGDGGGLSIGNYSLIIAEVSDLDPDDQISEASVITFATDPTIVTNYTLNTMTDVDLFSITLAAGQRLFFDIDRTTGSNLDSHLRVLDSLGTQLASNDDAPAPGENSSRESYLEYVFVSAGTYYIGVSGFGNNSYNVINGTGDTSGSIGGYTLTIGTPQPPDSDDQLGEATHIGTAGVSAALLQSGTVENPRDVDMVAFNAVAGQTLDFDIDSNGSGLDSYLRLFNTFTGLETNGGVALSFNNNAAAPGESAGLDSFLRHTFTVSGIYYIGISGNGNSAYNQHTGHNDVAGSTGAYQLSISEFVHPDSDDQLGEARLLGNVGATSLAVSNSISVSTDVDMYRFTVAANTRVGFDIDSSNLDSHLRVFDETGLQILFNDDGSAPGETSGLASYIEHTFTTGGTYYVGVSGFSNTSYSASDGTGDTYGDTGSYSLFITKRGTTVDLSGVFANAPSAVALGDPMTVSAQVRNSGLAPSGEFDVSFYLSRDINGSNDDILLNLAGGGSVYDHGAIGAGAVGAQFSVQLAIPASLPSDWTGTQFYVVMRTDVNNEITETNENNNWGGAGASDSLAVRPATIDLDATSVDAPSIGTLNNPIRVNSVVTNLGTANSGAFQVQFYLSKDATGSAEDILLDLAGGGTTLTQASLASGGTARITADLALPSSLPADWIGTPSYIVMRVDSGDTVTEINEANNFAGVGSFDSITLRNHSVDLLGSSLNAPTSGILGDTIRVSTQIRNTGTGNSGAFSVQFYLSKDALGSADDILLNFAAGGGTYTHASIAGGAYGTIIQQDLVLPGSLPANWSGTGFYLIMRTDSANVVAETNETNNWGGTGASDLISLSPRAVDLYGNSLVVPSLTSLGNEITISASVRNLGNASSGAFGVQFYISKDRTGSAEDILLDFVAGGSTHNHGTLAAGTTGAVFQARLAIPAALPSGWSSDYFFIVMRTDSGNTVAESNEANNFGSLGAGKDSDDVHFAGDWFSLNLRDGGIISLARSHFADNSLNRVEMIEILREAGADDGTVSADELTDLRTIVANSSYLQIADPVKVLANKVVNYNVANTSYQGSALGNLAAGSNIAHLSKLVDKWFLGTDRPDSGGYTYRTTSGSLFVGGASYTDVNQGAVGDCYFVATLAGLAQRDNTAITSMFTDNGDNTYTVRFYERGSTYVADYVTVDRQLPTDSSGRLIYAEQGSMYNNSGNELWVALAEKAYAQLNEERQVSQDGTNSYQGISGGWMEDVLEYVRGRNHTSYSTSTVQETWWVDQFNNSNGIMLTGTFSSPPDLVGSHAYTQVDLNFVSGQWLYDFYNPWGVQHGYGLTWARLRANFNWVAVG